jgi:hypothetical protein
VVRVGAKSQSGEYLGMDVVYVVVEFRVEILGLLFEKNKGLMFLLATNFGAT